VPKRYSLSGDSLAQVKVAIKAARTPAELRRALCVWLPAALSLTAEQTATGLACGLATVEQVQHRHRRLGVSAFRDHPKRAFPPGAAQELAAALKRARSPDEFRRLQCVALRAILDLDARQVGAAVGWAPATVSAIQSLYFRRGEAALVRALDPPAAVFPAGGSAEKLLAAMQNARRVADFRQALCLYLRIVLRFSSIQVAQILGWHQASVSHLHHKYLREGDAALRGAGRGGRRWKLLTREEEAEVLRKLAGQAWFNGLVEFSKIHAAFEKKAGHPVPVSVVLEILDRHHWVPGLVYVTPRQTRLPEGERRARAAEFRVNEAPMRF